MAVSSSSTDDQVQAQIDDNAGYDETNDLAKAKAYRTALRIMIGRLSRTAEQASQGDSLKSQLNGLNSEMDRVSNWLNAYDTSAADTLPGARPISVNLQNFRGY